MDELKRWIMAQPDDPAKPPLPPPPKSLEEAKTLAEIDAYMMSLSTPTPESQESSTTEPATTSQRST